MARLKEVTDVNSLEQIFTVDFSYKDNFYLNLSFTVLDWIVAEELGRGQKIHMDCIEEQQAV